MEEPPKLSGFGGLLRLMHYLYLITRDDGEQYVGVSKYPEERFKRHISIRGPNPYLRNKNCHLSILNKGSESLMYSLEKELIATNKFKLNTSPGRGGNYLGELHPSSKLTKKDVILIVKLLNEGMLSNAQIAKKFNVTKGVITQILKGKTWSHLGLEINPPKTKDFDVDLIIRDFINNLGIEKILNKYYKLTPKILYSIIKNINRDKTRKARTPISKDEIDRIKMLKGLGFSYSCIALDMDIGISTASKWGNS